MSGVSGLSPYANSMATVPSASRVLSPLVRPCLLVGLRQVPRREPISWLRYRSSNMMIVRASRRRGRTWPRVCRTGRSRSRSFAIGSRRLSASGDFPCSIIFGCVRRTCLSVRTRRSSGGGRSSGFSRARAAVCGWSWPCAPRPARAGWRMASAARTWIYFRSSVGPICASWRHGKPVDNSFRRCRHAPCSVPAWPRRGAASNQCGRIRNAEIRIHASGFARGASNPKPSLDIPDRNCRTIGTLLKTPGTDASSTPRT